jgi:hypothetical protein
MTHGSPPNSSPSSWSASIGRWAASVCSASVASIRGATSQRWMTEWLAWTITRGIVSRTCASEKTIADHRAPKWYAAASTTASHTATGPAGAVHSAEEIRSSVSIVWSRRSDLSRQAA